MNSFEPLFSSYCKIKKLRNMSLNEHKEDNELTNAIKYDLKLRIFRAVSRISFIYFDCILNRFDLN